MVVLSTLVTSIVGLIGLFEKVLNTHDWLRKVLSKKGEKEMKKYIKYLKVVNQVVGPYGNSNCTEGSITGALKLLDGELKESWSNVDKWRKVKPDDIIKKLNSSKTSIGQYLQLFSTALQTCRDQLPQANLGLNNTPFKFTKYSNDYMLVYVRESDKDKIICNVDDDEKDIAEHLRIVHFQRLDRSKEDDFCLELSKLSTYDDVVERVAQQLDLDDPSKIRLTAHNCYSQQPEPQPIIFRGVDHLSDMFIHYDQTANILYYEILDIPLPEQQGLKTLKVAFHHSTKDEVSVHSIRLPKQSTVGDVINELKTKEGNPAEPQKPPKKKESQKSREKKREDTEYKAGLKKNITKCTQCRKDYKKLLNEVITHQRATKNPKCLTSWSDAEHLLRGHQRFGRLSEEDRKKEWSIHANQILKKMNKQ